MVLLHSTVLRPWWKEETIFFLLCNNLKSFFSTFEHDNINDIIRVSTNKIWPELNLEFCTQLFKSYKKTFSIFFWLILKHVKMTLYI